ncbi:MAG: glycine--tRNA ligase subunit beta [Terriglobia bacterium]
MNFEFLLELGCEEIPARLIPSLLEQLSSKLAAMLDTASVAHAVPACYATPRRLVVVISEVSQQQPDRVEAITGPPFAVAYDAAGNPSKAALGFASKNQVTVDDLRAIDTPKGKYLGIEKKIPGVMTKELLTEGLPKILAQLEFPKGMRWEASHFVFVRPIRWILGLFGGEVLPLQVAGVSAADFTFGHRFLAENHKVKVSNFTEFYQKLSDLHVEIDPVKRRQRILVELNARSRQHGGELLPDEGLLDQVVHLHEFPSVISGKFDPLFLSLPQEVLVTVMREHQKYFSMTDAEGKLLPGFLAVVDTDARHEATIVSGHERVLKARLEDARFYWGVDTRHSLESRVEALRKIVFQAQLGTMLEKAQRLVSLVGPMAGWLGCNDKLEDLRLAARWCKTDLTTEMVKEFTDLQGVMGGLYAKAQGASETAAQAIYEHYRPGSWEDSPPLSKAGSVLSIADKLDSIVGLFSIGLSPTGSKDPLGLRRQTLGILKVILHHKLSISLEKLFKKSYTLFRKKATRPYEEVSSELQDFFKERLRTIFRDMGYRYDEINAIVERGVNNPLECLEKVSAISSMRESEDFYAVSSSFKRIKNIILKAGLSAESEFTFDPALLENEEEKALGQLIERVRPKVRRAAARHEFRKAFELMASLRPAIDLFFDKVLVMAEDPALQKNRLSLLGNLLGTFYRLADVSEVVLGSGALSS